MTVSDQQVSKQHCIWHSFGNPRTAARDWENKANAPSILTSALCKLELGCANAEKACYPIAPVK